MASQNHIIKTIPSIWESKLDRWSNPPGQTEEERCLNAERAIRKAIDASDILSLLPIEPFAQGSFRNRTNIPRESDVDICVKYSGAFYYDLPNGVTIQQASLDNNPLNLYFTYDTYKNHIGDALKEYFQSGIVTRGKKAFDIKDNTYRVSADVVPAWEYRDYFKTSNGQLNFRSGTAIKSDDGKLIINWPEQNYRNGVIKNNNTMKRYKQSVRALKNLCVEMRGIGIEVAERIPSYLCDCLLYNVDNSIYLTNGYYNRMRSILTFLYHKTSNDKDCNSMAEVNGIKRLFHSTQGWKREDVNSFISEAWTYLEL